MYMYPVVGIGMTCPDPKGDYTTPDGVVIPTGEGTNSDIGHSSLLYNEYPFTVKTMMVKIDIKFICFGRVLASLWLYKTISIQMLSL